MFSLSTKPTETNNNNSDDHDDDKSGRDDNIDPIQSSQRHIPVLSCDNGNEDKYKDATPPPFLCSFASIFAYYSVSIDWFVVVVDVDDD